MSLYSDFGPRRVRQIAADVIAGIVVVLSIVAGATVHSVISAFAAVWSTLEDAGVGFQQTMNDIGDNLGGVPLIGSGIRAPFDAASGAGGSLADAGRAGQSLIETTAVVAGLGVALLPISLLLIVWLWPRVRFVRRSAEARAVLALGDGEAVLALRALGTATAAQLSAISPHPVRDWQSGAPHVTRQLAALTARDAGVRIPAAGVAQRP